MAGRGWLKKYRIRPNALLKKTEKWINILPVLLPIYTTNHSIYLSMSKAP